ncbi:GntR family transcriptional regulator [Puniceibacterium sp. IMCC21224]|uniref:GntR family transcriptional regulator n=1 Tax=Puniceibacterium sp. IMCC21224 TaxID=1618204 RepID=UPI00064D8489
MIQMPAQGRDGGSKAVVDGLSLAIHEHRLAPGTKLGEDEIGEIYGVSRTVVRAALQQLSHTQLVQIERNRGAYVAQPTLREAREVFEARALLEGRTACWAAERATPRDVDRLERHIAEEHAALDVQDMGRALRLSGQFHIELARIADQDTIAGFVETLIARSSLVIALYWRRSAALCESNAHHALIQAIAANDGPRAQEQMSSHLIDILSSLDLRDRTAPPRTLRDALLGHA